MTSGNDQEKLSAETSSGAKIPGISKSAGIGRKSRLFSPKNPGAPGKLGKSSTLSESLSKLRGKGAIG